ncbi:hypothetical protein FISHEDRAFT_65037 [Fistulina hepatica ATCC 64428]|uniref:Cytochrome c oxidase assembly protein COX16, mitochondrial n=1 Tax=Fistulina hepatica ATCC 64428 TaxID=1128425 RepID=A0A0D7AHV4_9AGAR|nr:hypothetical protein FISHEDRAFT_65037 [Fistulina hepatica ATCC 64428]
MGLFDSKPLSESNINRAINRNPLLFGIPFILLMVGASYALVPLTKTRYEMHDEHVKAVSKEEELHLDKNRKKVDLREEYFRLTQEADQNWEQRRVPRPKGLPEWGVPPTESESRSKDNS